MYKLIMCDLQLAMATLGTTAVGIAFAMSGKEKAKEQGPPINAGSKDEEQFIEYVGVLWRTQERKQLL